MNGDDIYNHRACERCHAQKLRCRPQTADKCVRRTKANTRCISRPPVRLRRTENSSQRRSTSNGKVGLSESPEEVEVIENTESIYGKASGPNIMNSYPDPMYLTSWSPQNEVSNFDFLDTGTDNNANANLPSTDSRLLSDESLREDGTDLTFASVDYSSILDLPNETSHPLEFNEALLEDFPTHKIREPLSFGKEEWVEELTKLNTRVSKHNEAVTADIEAPSSSIPIAIPTPSVSDSGLDERGKLIRKDSRLLDETLALTTDLVNLIDKLALRTRRNRGGSRDETQGTDSTRHMSWKVNYPTPRSGERETHNPIHGDHFTSLLLISCYMRLLSIYKAFFANLHTVLNRTELPIEASEHSTHLPAIAVGSFTLSSSPRLQTLLVIELVAFLVGYIGDTIELAIPTADPSDCNVFNLPAHSSKSRNAMDDIVRSTYATMRAREKEMLDATRRIRRNLMDSRVKAGNFGDTSTYS